MTENQRRADDVVTARDLVLRALLALSLVGGAFALLLVVQPS